MLAYKPGVMVADDATLTAASLLIVIVATALGFAVAAAGSRSDIIVGGVETREQLDLVRSEGCTEMQGFYFTSPITAEELRRRFLAVPAGQQASAGIVAA